MKSFGLGFELARLRLFGVWQGDDGQDMIEYALLAGFIAVLIGAMIPGQIIPSLSCIYSRLNNVMGQFGGS